MRVGSTFNVAFRALRRNKLRSALTALGILTAVSEEMPSRGQSAAGNQKWFTRVMGGSPDYFDIRQWLLAEGAPFTAQDVRSADKVCVIGQTTATQVFGNDDPVGQTLRIKNVP